MTPHALRRLDGYCLNEVAKAMELIIPVLLVQVPDSEPTSVCPIQYLEHSRRYP